MPDTRATSGDDSPLDFWRAYVFFVDQTGRQAVLYAAALLPVTLQPSFVGLVGPRYQIGAMVLGLLFLWLSFDFGARGSLPTARRLFAGSILYLPLLWLAMLADHLSR